MFRLSSDISIGPYRFRGVTELQIESSWELLTDTCRITFPRRVSWQGRELATGTDPLLMRDMPVTVGLGYDDVLEEVFQGYVREVTAKIPIEVVCEDAMYLLKRGEFTRSYRAATLSGILGDMLAGIVPYQVVADRDLGQLRISRATPAKVLEELRSKYYVKMFFRAGTLYAGLAYVPELQRRRRIKFELQVIDNDLEYRRREDVKINLTAVIVQPDNSREEVLYGDPEGEKRTLYYYNVPKSAVQKQLGDEIERLKYDGYRGTFTTFGQPDIQHGDVVELISEVYPERDGAYLVKRVEKTFGQGGYRQTVEIESKV